MWTNDLELRAEYQSCRAWIDAVLAAAESPSWVIAHWEADAYWDQRRRIVLAQAQDRVELSEDQLPPDLDPEIRRAILGPDVAETVLGYVQRRKRIEFWVPGLAALTRTEAQAFRFWLEPNDHGELRSAKEIRDMIDRQRGPEDMPVAIKTIENRLWEARRKLRALVQRMADAPA